MGNMGQIIRVVRGFSLKEHRSFDKAVHAAMSQNIDSRRAKCELINGKKVLDYQFDGEYLVVHFNNEKYLIISSGENKIIWDVVSTKPQVGTQIDYEDVYFEFSSGNQAAWDWKNVLDSFVGEQVAISPSDQYLFIFTKDGKEYMIDSLISEKNPEDRFLFISES